MTSFRFAWRRRPNTDREAYDAFEGKFKVAQVVYEPGLQANHPKPYRWILSAFLMTEGRVQPEGRAATPREAAMAAEAAFPLELPNVYGIAMRTERAIELCRLLGIDLPPQTRWQAERFGLSSILCSAVGRDYQFAVCAEAQSRA